MSSPSVLVCAVLAALVMTPTMHAQQTQNPFEEQIRRQQEQREKERAEQREYERQLGILVPLDVQLVIARYQGDKKVSSLPYSLTVNAVHRHAQPNDVRIARVRMGAQVPLPAMAEMRTTDGKPISALTGVAGGGPVQYKEIGTFIDAHAKWLDGGAYELHVSVSDTSLYKRPDPGPLPTGERLDDMGLPVLRTFMAENDMVLKDGQTKQFMLAADRISGDTLRVDVTLKVAK